MLNPSTTCFKLPETPGSPGVTDGFRGQEAVDRVPAPVLAAGYENLGEQPELAAAWAAEVLSRQAEAARIAHLLEYRDRRLAEQEQTLPHTFKRQAVSKAVHHEAAVLLGVADHQVRRMLATAETAKRWLPQTWDTYQMGRIDFARLQKLVTGAGELIETNSGTPEVQQQLTAALDEHFSPVVPGENESVLDQQVRDFVAAADPAGHQRRYERAQGHRHVVITHHHNGMSTLRALLPTLTLARLEEGLHAAARVRREQQCAEVRGHADSAGRGSSGEATSDETTLANRMADTLTAWLEAGSAGADTTPNGGAVVNITVPFDTLTGASQDPAVSSDNRFTLPAAEARRIVNDPDAANTYYLTGITSNPDGAQKIERIVKVGKKNPLAEVAGGPGSPELVRRVLTGQLRTRPNLLEGSSSARFVTGNLRTGVMLRDKQCQAHGCVEPASFSEVDHKTSHETGGATDGTNSQVLCHLHHVIKSHGHLPAGESDTAPARPPAQSRSRAGSDPPSRSSPGPPPSWATAGADPPPG